MEVLHEDTTPVAQAAAAAVQALKSGDEVAAAQAAVHICLLTTGDSPPSNLLEGVPALVNLLRSESPALQQNACAALTGLVGGVAGAADAAAAEGVTERLVELLREPSSRTTAGLNVLETLSALASAGGLGTDAALVAGAPAAVVDTVRLAAEAPHDAEHALAEAAADAACALASSGAACAAALREAGAVPAMAALLGHASSETRVRALLGLSMLLSERSAAVALIAAPLALSRIRAMAAAPQSEADETDGDECAIAGDLLAALSSAPGLSELLVQA